MSLQPSVRRWIGEQKAGQRIANSAPAKAARKLDISARLVQAQAAITAAEPSALRKREQQQIDQFLDVKTPEPRRPVPASAPPIATIRRSLAAGRNAVFKRDRGERTIVFKTGTIGATTPVHDEGGGRMRRRQRRRSPNRNGTLL